MRRWALLALVAATLACTRKPATLVIAAAGDLQLGTASTPAQLEGLETLLQGDVRFINLEGPLTTRGPEMGLRFAGPPAAAGWLSGRVDVVSLANNHALDQGPEGLADTATALAHSGILSAAPARAAELPGPGGDRLIFVAGDLPTPIPSDAAERISREVSAARRRGIVVVSLHWGRAGTLTPTPEQRALAARLVDAGASAVLGHGPHTLQGVERRGRAVIAYSLGNLAFACACTDERDAFVLRFALDRAGQVSDIQLLPIAAGLAGKPPRRATDPDLPRLVSALSRDLGSDVALEAGTVRIR